MFRNACNGENGKNGEFELDAKNRYFKKGPFAISIKFCSQFGDFGD